ncbi:unnamed protein product [Peniophora sp. CBMAI 1063]|nr:unnamed protein product [Peniophora sp. CBMAI 1063]
MLDGARALGILSAQALDIINFLVVGFLQIHAILRDDYKAEYPFYPWLVGTTPCELTFGAARGCVKDFTALDWQYMAPKLAVKLRQLVSGSDTASIVRSEGYNYDLAANAARLTPAARASALTFVSHDRIIAISRTAYSQASSIASMLGVDVKLFERDVSTLHMPPMVPTRIDDVFEDDDGYGSDGWELDDSGSESAESDDEEELSEEQLQQIVHWAVDLDVSEGQRDQLNKLAYAVSAFTLQSSTDIRNMPAMTDEMYDEDVAKIGATFAAHLPPLVVPLEPALQHQPYNIDSLLQAHEYMETEHSKRVVRQRKGPKGPIPDGSQVAAAGSDDRAVRRMRAVTAKQYRAVLTSPDEQRATQGIGRITRWTAKPSKAGNAQNAAVSAEGRAGEAIKKRAKIFVSTCTLPSFLTRAEVDLGRRLFSKPREEDASCCWGLAWYNDTVCLVEVHEIYVKGGGEAGRHAFSEECKSIGSASNIGVRVHYPSSRNSSGRPKFLIRPTVDRWSQHPHPVSRYTLLESQEFLVRLSEVPSVNGFTLTVGSTDVPFVSSLQSQIDRVDSAMKEWKKRPRKTSGKQPAVVDGDGDEEECD